MEKESDWFKELRKKREQKALAQQQALKEKKSIAGKLERFGKTISKLRRGRIATGPITSTYRAIAPSKLGRSPFKLKRKTTKYQGKKGHARRGRPKGSYKYFIPGKGPVSVFTWRKYLSQQKQLMKMRLQQLKAKQQVYSPIQQQALQQQIQQQMIQQPQPQIQSPQGATMPPAYIPEPTYEQRPSDLKIWEEGPGLGLNPTIQQQSQMIQEVDLATGKIRLKKGGSFL